MNTTGQAKYRRSKIAISLLIMMLLSIMTSITPASAASQVRILELGGTVKITDDENWPESDEVQDIPLDDVRIAVGRRFVPVYNDEWCVGDEVRVTLSLQAAATKSGSIRLRGTAKLYEGVSCSTDDLEASKSLRQLISPTLEEEDVDEIEFPLQASDSSGRAEFKIRVSNVSPDNQ